MATELESIWKTSIPAIDTVAGDDEVITRDVSADDGQQVKKSTITKVYNYIKGLLDTAYGAFVTRWPTFAEVTSKPLQYPVVRSEVTVNTASTEVDLSGRTCVFFNMEANTTLTLSTTGLERGFVTFVFTQDATGSRTVTLDSSLADWSVPSGTFPGLSTAANAVDVATLFIEPSTNTAYLLQLVKAYSVV